MGPQAAPSLRLNQRCRTETHPVVPDREGPGQSEVEVLSGLVCTKNCVAKRGTLAKLRFLFAVFLALAVAMAGPRLLRAEGDEALKAGIDAYVYAYPLVFMDVTRLYVEKATGAQDNVFFQGGVFADAGSTAPDDNLLVSSAWLDLSKEPVILHMPDFGARYRRAQLTDGWANVQAILRTGNGARDFALVGPFWTGGIPPGLIVINSPTNMALIEVRLLSTGAAEDIAAVCALQGQMSLTPLSLYNGPKDAEPVEASFCATPMKPPTEQIADMDARAFFTHFTDLLASNPPAAADSAMMERLASLGIVPAPAFEFDKLDPATRDELSRSMGPAQIRVQSPSLPRAVSDARMDPDPSAYYAYRAHRAMTDLAIDVPVSQEAETQAPGFESKSPLSVEDGILFNPEGHGTNGTGFDIRDDIARGQAFLKDKTAGYSLVLEERRVTFRDRKGRRRERLITKRITRPNFLLAVEDLKERTIRPVLITARGCVTKGFAVTRTLDNGVASRFEVTYPENMAILALRTMVRSDAHGLEEVVYTPYSPEIDTWQVRKAGLDYLMERIKLARKELDVKKVRLDGFDETGDATPLEVSLVLSIIEHIDPGRFERRRGHEIALVHEVLTIIGANTTRAYSYSRSPAGARGLFQIVPDTYRRLREKYQSAGLTKDFVSGCNDHTNAAMAALLLFNSDLASLPRKWSRAAGKDGRSIGTYLAAAYNCGPKRVERSARQCRSQWTCRLPEETRVYLKKFEAVWGLRNVLDK